MLTEDLARSSKLHSSYNTATIVIIISTKGWSIPIAMGVPAEVVLVQKVVTNILKDTTEMVK